MFSEKIYILIIFVFSSFVYYQLVFETYIRHFAPTLLTYTFLGLIHLFILLLVWSIVATTTTDPGKQPVFWGFYMDEPQNRRKRYCLICHLFKPERCHHCSTCQRCVLGMDHHCPWLATCVGYYNRRFFILTLAYTVLSIATILLFNAQKIWKILLRYYADFRLPAIIRKPQHLICVLTYLYVFVFFFVILKFFLYHVRLLFANNTTLEQLDSKRKKEPIETKYNIGIARNIASVMGSNYIGWILPLSSLPMPSDGVVWITSDSVPTASPVLAASVPLAEETVPLSK